MKKIIIRNDVSFDDWIHTQYTVKDYYRISVEICGWTFTSDCIATRQEIMNRFDLTDEQFNAAHKPNTLNEKF